MKQLKMNVSLTSNLDFLAAHDESIAVTSGEMGKGGAEGGVFDLVNDGGGRIEDAGETRRALRCSGVRLFFPCNREDALVFLGGLCISEFYPEPNVALALQSDGIALLEDGLRVTEEKLLNAGRAENFPVLVEVCSSFTFTVPRVIEHDKIIGLWFRTQSEADDFKLRPVEEFDTETYACRVDFGLFNMEGSARFSIRSESDALQIGRVADRLVAGVHYALSLGNTRADCRNAILAFLNQLSNDEPFESLDFAIASKAAIDPLATSSGLYKRHAAVISAFLNADDLSPRSLMEDIEKRLVSIPKENDVAEERDRRWGEVADAVISSKVALNGELLADEKSILLRGVLLALVVDSVESLSVFLDADKPSGPNVTTLAAFLIGMKQGVMNTSWKYKKEALQQISFLMGLIIRTLARTPSAMGDLFTKLEEASGSAIVVSIVAGGRRLVEWPQEKRPAIDEVTRTWLEDFENHGFEVVERGRGSHSWVIRLGDAHMVEVVHSLSGETRFPSFRFYLDIDQRLKKSKDLDAVQVGGARFWYLGKEEVGGGRFLFCDLPSLPDSAGADLIKRMLVEALELYLVPKKQVSPRRKRKVV